MLSVFDCTFDLHNVGIDTGQLEMFGLGGVFKGRFLDPANGGGVVCNGKEAGDPGSVHECQPYRHNVGKENEEFC